MSDLARIILIVIAIFTSYFSETCSSFLIAFLGWMFFPLVTLSYIFLKLNNCSELAFICCMTIAVILDLGCTTIIVNDYSIRINKL